MKRWWRNNIFANGDYLLGIPLVLCWLPLLSRCLFSGNAYSTEWAWIVFWALSFPLFLVIFYRPTTLFWVPLAMMVVQVPDEFQAPPRTTMETFLSPWKYSWWMLLAALAFRVLCQLYRQHGPIWNDSSPPGPPPCRSRFSDFGRLSRPFRLSLHLLACTLLMFYLAVGLRLAELNRALYDAVSSDEVTTVHRLLAQGSNPNMSGDHCDLSGDCYGSDPVLCIALHINRYEIVEALLLSGANVHTRDYGNDPPLVAGALTNVQIIRLLLQYGADINARGANGQTALMAAEHPDIVRELIAHGADLKAQDDDGDTALMHVYHSPEVFRTLLKSGADPDVRNKEGKTVKMLLQARRRDVDDAESHRDCDAMLTQLAEHGVKE